jgi:hypothetical protein
LPDHIQTGKGGAEQMKPRHPFIALLFVLVVLGCGQNSTEDTGTSTPSDVADQSTPATPRDGDEHEPDVPWTDIPEQPVSGQVMGRPFLPEGFDISEMGNLDMWVGDRLFPSAKLSIMLPLNFGESPAGRSYHFDPSDRGGFRPSIQIHMKSESEKPIFRSYRDHYLMKLHFDEAAEHQIKGGIYLRLPDNDAQITGVFQVAVPENPAQPPEKRHRPYVHGRIEIAPQKERMLSAGYAGMGNDGSVYTNGAGLTLTPGDASGSREHVQSTTFKPRTTSVWRDDQGAMHFRHVRLEPGIYLFSIRWGGDLVAHQWQRVHSGAAVRWDAAIDLSKSGTLFVSVDNLKAGERIWLLPLTASGDLPDGVADRKLWRLPFHLQVKPVYKGDAAEYRLLPPGYYLVLYNDRRQKVKMGAGKYVKIALRQ